MRQRTRIFDSNVYSSYKNQLTTQDAKSSALSVIVFYELTATKIDSQKRRLWNGYFQNHSAKKTLIVPSKEDWQICSQIIWQMHRNNEGVPRAATALQNDTLICQSAISWQRENSESHAPCAVITENYKHFSLIARYLNSRLKKDESKLVVVSAKNYFSV